VGKEKALPAVILRKRQIDSNSHNNRHCLRHIKLTQENLAAFNKMARKKAIKAIVKYLGI
jgi:hypothetical protein